MTHLLKQNSEQNLLKPGNRSSGTGTEDTPTPTNFTGTGHPIMDGK